MEEHVGMIANNPNYKLEELEKLYENLNPTSGNNESASQQYDRGMSNSAPGTAGHTAGNDILERPSAA